MENKQRNRKHQICNSNFEPRVGALSFWASIPWDWSRVFSGVDRQLDNRSRELRPKMGNFDGGGGAAEPTLNFSGTFSGSQIARRSQF